MSMGMGMGPMGEHGRGGPGSHGGRHGKGGAGPMGAMLDAADASKEQRIKIRQIMVAAEEDVRAMHANPGEQRDAMARLLAQPRIDAAAVEKLRTQNLARHEAVSKRMSQAMVEAANVLTPEQRAKAADAMSRRRAMMDGPASRMGAGPAPGRPAARPDDAASR